MKRSRVVVIAEIQCTTIISYVRPKRNGCTLVTAHQKFQQTLAGAEKSVKYQVWPGRNKTYFYHTIRRETRNLPAKVFTKSAGWPAKRRPLRFFTPRPNTARKFLSCRSDKGYQQKCGIA